MRSRWAATAARPGWSGSGSSAAALMNGAAPEAGFGHPRREELEDGEELLAGLVVGCLDRRIEEPVPVVESTIQVGRDQRVLRTEVLVEAGLRHPRLGQDPIDADRADALGVEEPIGGGEQAVRRRGAAGRGRGAAIA